MGFFSFIISKKKLVNGVIDTSKKYNLSYDESILEDKNKMVDWLFEANKKIQNNDYTLANNCETSISDINKNIENTNTINPASGLPMNGNIDITGNPFGSSF